MFHIGIGLIRLDIVTLFRTRGEMIVIPDDILVFCGDFLFFFKLGKVSPCGMSGSDDI